MIILESILGILGVLFSKNLIYLISLFNSLRLLPIYILGLYQK